MFKKLQGLDAWTKVALFLLYGSLFLGRAEAYIGLGFGGLMLLSPRVFWDRWYNGLTRRLDPLREIAWPLLLSLLYGFAQLIYGLLLGYSVLTAFQILVFNVFPVYLLLGIWAGYRHPGMVRTYIRFVAWYVAAYTPLYFLFLHNLSIAADNSDNGWALIGHPGPGSATLLGLLAYEPKLGKFWFPILVLSGLTIANQERADWLGLALALIIWGKLSRRMGRVFSVLGALAAILLFAALIDLKLPPLPGRGGELSARGTIGRMAGAISPELAEEFAGNQADANFYYGTVYWRKHWWANIREEVSKDPVTLVFGLGYGYPLAKLTGNAGTVQQGTRSPHNIFYFTLAYSGLVGVAIFFWLEICLARLLYRVYRVTGQIYGLAFFVYTIVNAFFGNLIETPYAIPIYLVLGLCIGPMFLQMDTDSGAVLAEPVQVAELV